MNGFHDEKRRGAKREEEHETLLQFLPVNEEDERQEKEKRVKWKHQCLTDCKEKERDRLNTISYKGIKQVKEIPKKVQEYQNL